jgi:hypothetical protein
VSKQRAVRRAERERLSAAQSAARAAEQERERRRTARKKRLTGWLPAPSARPTGILAERRRTRVRILIALVVLVNVLVWLVSPDWAARLGALVVSLLLLPVLLLVVS